MRMKKKQAPIVPATMIPANLIQANNPRENRNKENTQNERMEKLVFEKWLAMPHARSINHGTNAKRIMLAVA